MEHLRADGKEVGQDGRISRAASNVRGQEGSTEKEQTRTSEGGGRSSRRRRQPHVI